MNQRDALKRACRAVGMPGLLIILVTLAVPGPGLSRQDAYAGQPVKLAGLEAAAEIVRDDFGIAHVRAANEHDLFFLQGYVHAQDRLFQMDYFRHVSSGTLAELVGMAGLPTDIQLRTLGLRRAGQRSWSVISPRSQAILQAYAEGVNACAATHPLPPEYGALGVGQFEPWQPLDTLAIVKLLSWQMMFNDFDMTFTVALMSYQQAGGMLGFDGAKLFYEDLFRAAPFETAATVPDAGEQSLLTRATGRRGAAPQLDPETLELVKRHLKETGDLEFFRKLREGAGGSNEWVVGGSLSSSGRPLLANDPHIEVPSPSLFYPIHLSAGDFDVTGQSFAGCPTVIMGHGAWFSWGFTAAYADTLDYYSEQVVPDQSSPSGFSTLYGSSLEPVIPVPQVFRARVSGQLVVVPPGGGVPAATLVMPRRNNGPIVKLDPATGAAVSMQWAGFAGSTELDGTMAWAEARTVAEFRRGTRLFSFPQNVVFADRSGNFGYIMAGEVPIREDLQAGTVAGSPPWLLRNGRGGNEWLAVQNPQPGQALPYEILPAEEMPSTVNPPAGFVVNANNDPLGTNLSNDPLGTTRPGGGILYLAYLFNPGWRAARITELIREKTAGGGVSIEDMRAIQADTALLDARYFVPFVTRALQNGLRGGAPVPLALLAMDPAVGEAVGRLSAWDFTAPTGIPQGYDAFDEFGHLGQPSAAEIARSVAATLFAMWRSEFIAGVIDSKLSPYNLPVPGAGQTLNALRHLLESFPANQGVGASGLNFFPVPEVAGASDRRDIYILQAVKSALGRLAGDGFKNAFGNSTNQNDYRWGKLNRLILNHPLGSVFSIPPAGGTFPAPLPGLPGIPIDGGFQSVDPTTSAVRALNENSFIVNFGPGNRTVAEAMPSGIRGVSSLPGGTSGVLGSPFYWNLLPGWLTNSDYYEQLYGPDELAGRISSVLKLVPSQVGTFR